MAYLSPQYGAHLKLQYLQSSAAATATKLFDNSLSLDAFVELSPSWRLINYAFIRSTAIENPWMEMILHGNPGSALWHSIAYHWYTILHENHYIHRGRLCPVTPALTHFMWDGGVTEENDQSSALLLKTAARAVPVCCWGTIHLWSNVCCDSLLVRLKPGFQGSFYHLLLTKSATNGKPNKKNMYLE